MSEQTATQATPPKKRGVAFPQLSLEASVAAIVSMGQHGADHSQDAAAAYLGHSTTNSGAYRVKLAALRDWGLIKRGDKDRVTLTDLAKDLVLESPDQPITQALLLTAFQSCSVFEQLYEDSAKNLAQDFARFRTVVVMRHNVATDQADKFVDVFVDSAEYAGLAKVEGGQVTLLPRESATAAPEPAWEIPEDVKPFTLYPDGKTMYPEPRRVTVPTATEHVMRHHALGDVAPDQPPAPKTPVALRQAWPIDGGEIEFVIRTPKALPPSIYAVMAEMAEVAAKMEALLKSTTVEASVAPASPVGDDN